MPAKQFLDSRVRRAPFSRGCHWRAMWARSLASGSWMSSRLTSTVTWWIVPVNVTERPAILVVDVVEPAVLDEQQVSAGRRALAEQHTLGAVVLDSPSRSRRQAATRRRANPPVRREERHWLPERKCLYPHQCPSGGGGCLSRVEVSLGRDHRQRRHGGTDEQVYVLRTGSCPADHHGRGRSRTG